MSSISPRATRKPPAERQAEIRAAAIELALDEGLDGISLRKIASRIGVTPPLVSHYHPTMDELVADTFSAIVTAEIDELQQALSAESDPVATVRRYLDFLLLDTRDEITVVWLDGWSRGRRNAALAQAVRGQMDAWQQFTRQLIEAGAASGAFEVDDPQRAAWRLLGIVDGLNAHSLVHVANRARARAEVAIITEAELGLRAGQLAASDY
jgi:AcrR family transcriptional regulator